MSIRLSARDGERLTQARDAHLRGELEKAQPVYQRLARKYPANDDVRSLLAALHLDSGQPERALPMLRGLTRSRPKDADAHYNLGLTHMAMGAYAEAAAAYRSAIRCNPKHPRAHYNLAVVCSTMGNKLGALQALADDYALAPGVDTCRLLTEISEEESDLPSALVWAQRCLEIEGASLEDLNRFVDLAYRVFAATAVFAEAELDACIALADHAVQLAPGDPTVLANAARMHTQAGQFRCALPLLETAVELAPEDDALRTLLGVALCTVGDLKEGWLQRTWIERTLVPRSAHGVKRWKGQSKPGSTMLVSCEQGVGDQVLYARMLPQLADMGFDVTYLSDERLVVPLGRTYPQVNVVSQVEDAGAFDFFTTLGELHLYLNTDVQAGLIADGAALDAWRNRFAGKRAVGLSWLSHSEANGASKSLPVESLRPLLDLPDTVFVDVQYGEGREALITLCEQAGAELVLPEINLDSDLEGGAALLAALDDVVTVSNATAHMAAATGVRTHVIVGKRPVWHWQDHGNDSPWYPSIKLYRQTDLANWQAPLEALNAALRGE